MARDAADERPHALEEGVSEAWSFDFAAADGALGGWVRFARHRTHAWYQAMLAGPRRQLLAVIEHRVPHRSNPLEIRTTDLWADHICETPFDHWTLGLEAFALGVDDPLELHGRQVGDRVPLGFDLEWDTDGPVLEPPAPTGVHRYEVPCRIHGEVLVGAEVIDFDGVGSREHEWGPIDWWADEGWRLTGMFEGHLCCSVDHRQGRSVALLIDREGRVSSEPVEASIELDLHGLPTAARVEGSALSLRSEVLAVTPLPISDEGREAHRPRALCRHRLDDGRIGVGWVEVRSPTVGLLETAGG